MKKKGRGVHQYHNRYMQTQEGKFDSRLLPTTAGEVEVISELVELECSV